MNPQEIFNENLELIKEICSSVCKKKGCWGADAEDFTSQVFLSLIKNDYAKLKSFKGRSSLKSFLRVVVLNLFRDYRNQKWGKWRPSKEAMRHGDVGQRLDQLLNRDSYSLHEAIEILRTNFRVTSPTSDIEEIAARLPERPRRRFEDDSQLSVLPTHEAAEQRVLDRETAETARMVNDSLNKALADLPAEDRLVLKMRFSSGFSVTRIAVTLHMKRRSLYSRIDRTLRALRTALQKEGLSAEEVRTVLGWDGPDDDPGAGNLSSMSVSSDGTP